MTSAAWLGVVLGGGLGLLYGLASCLAWRWAQHQQVVRRFLLVYFGTMGARLLIGLTLVTLIVVLFPVDEFAFVGTFFAVFVAGLILEVVQLHRVASAPPPGAQRESSPFRPRPDNH